MAECANVGLPVPFMTVSPLSIGTSSATASISASPSTVPREGTSHKKVVLAVSISASLALAALAASLIVWYICVRRRRRVRFDLGGSEEGEERKALTERDSTTIFRGAATVAESDSRTWPSMDHASELSDDGTPFATIKALNANSLTRPRESNPTRDQDYDRIVSRVTTILASSTPPPVTREAAPPVYHD